ncbi:MAG: sigma-70 family RNA polymerase sigma factor [Candidatus Omnitrophica bacterium]|nr:sigma-70 family RNA polymerase sigma factor [Candidatus Omnitrophota bacterium]
MNDLKFLRRCLEGERVAWDEFLKRYSRLIYSYIYNVLKLKGKSLADSEEVENIFQEIFVFLTQDNFKKLRTFKAKNGCSLASWLRVVVINYTIDYLRKKRNLVSLEEENEQGLSLKDTLRDDSTSVLDKLESEEMLLSLKDCIERLNIEERYFLELYLNQRLALEQISRHLKLSRPAVDVRKKRIIDKLKDCFRHKGFMLDN